MSFLAALKRRNVFKVALAYGITSRFIKDGLALLGRQPLGIGCVRFSRTTPAFIRCGSVTSVYVITEYVQTWHDPV